MNADGRKIRNSARPAAYHEIHLRSSDLRSSAVSSFLRVFCALCGESFGEWRHDVEEGADHPQVAAVGEAGDVLHHFDGDVLDREGAQALVMTELGGRDDADAEPCRHGFAHAFAAA